MKKALQSIATIALLGALIFLSGEWPENTEITKVLLCDGGALAVILGSGLYLKISGAYKAEK